MKHGAVDFPSEGGLWERLLISLPCGLLLCSGDGDVLFVNECARTIISRSGQLSLAGSRIAAAGAASEAMLRDALAATMQTRQPRYLRLGDGRTDEVWVLMTWLAPHIRGDSCYLRLLLANSRAGLHYKASALRQLFGMSEAEAAIAIEFASGETAPSIARERGVSIHTVRTQVRKALYKSGSERVADLIRTIASIPFHWEP